MRLSENIMKSTVNVDYEVSYCKRGKVVKFKTKKKIFYFFCDNCTIEIEDTNKVIKTVKGLKTQFKKYSGGEELVFYTTET